MMWCNDALCIKLNFSAEREEVIVAPHALHEVMHQADVFAPKFLHGKAMEETEGVAEGQGSPIPAFNCRHVSGQVKVRPPTAAGAPGGGTITEEKKMRFLSFVCGKIFESL